ncbi:hypothetical protein [Sphingomonas desiccabilis]|uniref:Uncharacterized protein n=1 Tax=Sphingomonas desiccabilis TaxID=429134 RepID=A0A4Q2J1V4_9SPHN|nr:hypothetical protein [Sphingomonas desiccabilis]MBB3910869.1 hypothetical protein [Sphingomonas desiccabilis]RXZ35471.1 hypothetical protein EO081_07590 [Sphingomonas desiccabilis]
MSRRPYPSNPAWLPVVLACMIFGSAGAAGASDWRAFAVFTLGVLVFGWPYAARMLAARTSRRGQGQPGGVSHG